MMLALRLEWKTNSIGNNAKSANNGTKQSIFGLFGTAQVVNWQVVDVR